MSPPSGSWEWCCSLLSVLRVWMPGAIRCSLQPSRIPSHRLGTSGCLCHRWPSFWCWTFWLWMAWPSGAHVSEGRTLGGSLAWSKVCVCSALLDEHQPVFQSGWPNLHPTFFPLRSFAPLGTPPGAWCELRCLFSDALPVAPRMFVTQSHLVP